MAEPNEPAPSFMTGAEVCKLLHIARSTLPAWRAAGLLVGHQLPSGQWRYPDDQAAIVDARAALAAGRDVCADVHRVAGQIELELEPAATS